jgi:hypothetical protein
MKNISDLVYGYKTKNKEGFTNKELDKLMKEFPALNEDKFNSAFFGNTCMKIDGEIIHYHCDVLTALRCGTENRDILPHEFD